MLKQVQHDIFPLFTNYDTVSQGGGSELGFPRRWGGEKKIPFIIMFIITFISYYHLLIGSLIHFVTPLICSMIQFARFFCPSPSPRPSPATREREKIVQIPNSLPN